MGLEKPQAVANPAGAGEKNGVAATKTAVPTTLVGQWQSGSLAATNFYDPGTQQWSGPSGRGIFLIVQADGKYRFGAGEQIATTQYFLYQEGTVTIDGSSLVFTPKAASEYTRDASAPQRKSQRAASPGELQPSTMRFQIVPDQANRLGSSLLLTDEHGEMITLRADAQ
jgi:hypothetical protein